MSPPMAEKCQKHNLKQNDRRCPRKKAKNMCQRTLENMPPGNRSDRMSQHMSAKLAKKSMPTRMPEGMPQRIGKDMSERVPEDLSE